jgi:PilZ domain
VWVESVAERRKHKRFELKNGAFVFFGFERAMAGKVLDISLQGLGFTYLASKGQTTTSIKLTLVYLHRSFHCPGIVGRTVFDYQMRQEDINGEGRCGIQFEQLTEDQKGDIEDLMEWIT